MSEPAAAQTIQTLREIERPDPSPRPPDPTVPVAWTPASERRPRLQSTPEELEELKTRLEGPVEAAMLERLRARCEAIRAKEELPEPGAPITNRVHSWAQAYPALLYALSGDKKELELAKTHTLALARCRPAFIPTRDLGASHALTALAWSYDFLYEEWTKSERRAILDFVREFGTHFFATTGAPVCYWSSALLQNHTQVAWTAFGQAGAAFHEEIEPAREWAQWAQRIYRTIAWLQPPDGSNMEGPSYGGYGNERRVIHYETAKRCFGENLYGPGERESVRWHLHLSLPDARAEHNAFSWGDNPPRFDTHGPVHTLLAHARAFQDPLAQGVALDFWRKKIGNRSVLTWMDLLLYDPSVPEKSPVEANEPSARHFEDLDLIGVRDGWEKRQGTAVSFRCGPYQGHRLMRWSSGDLGGAHCHPDVNALQLYSRGEFLLRDPGYEHIKRTAYHNTVLVDGHGQVGEGSHWYDVNRVLNFAGGTGTQIRSFRETGRAAAWVGDGAAIYLPEAGVKRFLRHVLYVRPDLLVVLDDLEAERPSVFTQLWHAETDFSEQPGGEGGGWGFTQGRAAFSVWPLSVMDGENEKPAVSARRQALADLIAEGESQAELRIESPRRERWTFATLFAIGDAGGPPPRVEARAALPEIEILESPAGALTVRFALEDAAPPSIV